MVSREEEENMYIRKLLRYLLLSLIVFTIASLGYITLSSWTRKHTMTPAAGSNFVVKMYSYKRHQTINCEHRKRGYITTDFLSRSGFGNVMFQLASLYGISMEYFLTPVIPSNFSLIDDYFKNLNHTLSLVKTLSADMLEHKDKNRWAQVLEAKASSYDTYLVKNINPCFNITLVGFFQSYRYFEKHEAGIRKLFMFSEEVVRKAEAILRDKVAMLNVMGSMDESSRGDVYIGVHVRYK